LVCVVETTKTVQSNALSLLGS